VESKAEAFEILDDVDGNDDGYLEYCPANDDGEHAIAAK